MSAKLSLLLATGLVLALTTLLLVWPTGKRSGGLSVTFVGKTNDVAGKPLAQFSVANHFRRRVRFGVCEVQVYGTNRWPDWVRDAGAGAWLTLAAGSERVVSVPAPALETAQWRVPFMCQEDLSFSDELRFRIDGLAWAIPRWRPGKPPPVRNGDRFHRTLVVYGPEMLGTGIGH
jgi:hypothetical protein